MPVTVTVNDGKGGMASATVNIQVIRPPVKTYTFEDVHFDFDRYTLRPEATRVLDEAVAAMKQDATLRLQLEGHTCNIGTAEYNLALGDRRANAVRDYLINRGVAAGRLSTVSYGEERPKYDNAREETRRLNRRAALVVNLTEVRVCDSSISTWSATSCSSSALSSRCGSPGPSRRSAASGSPSVW